jgi:hypothetical protein
MARSKLTGRHRYMPRERALNRTRTGAMIASSPRSESLTNTSPYFRNLDAQSMLGVDYTRSILLQMQWLLSVVELM